MILAAGHAGKAMLVRFKTEAVASPGYDTRTSCRFMRSASMTDSLFLHGILPPQQPAREAPAACLYRPACRRPCWLNSLKSDRPGLHSRCPCPTLGILLSLC